MPLFSEFFSTNDNCMCNVYGGWMAIQSGAGKILFKIHIIGEVDFVDSQSSFLFACVMCMAGGWVVIQSSAGGESLIN